MDQPYPIVIIEWQDASATAEWTEVADHQKIGVESVFSCGYLIRETKDVYCVAAAVSGTQANAVISIPKSWAKRKQTLRIR